MPRAYNRRTRQWIKPPLGSQIDWGHPLATGLAACWLLNERGGSIAFDIASRNILPLSGNAKFGAVNVSGAPGAYGLLTPTTSDYATHALPAQYKFQGPISVVYQGVLTGTPASYSTLFGAVGTSYWNYGFQYHGTTLVPQFVTNNATSQVVIGGNPSTWPAVSGRFQIVGTWPGSSGSPATYPPWNSYQQNAGAVGTNVVASGASITYDAGAAWGFSASGGGADATLHEFGLIYNYCLTPNFSEWLYQEPYAYILPPMSTRYFFLSSSSTIFRRTLYDRVGSRGAV